jgi:putative MFS transporter
VQEFVPASKRGWITGVTTMLPAGFVLGPLLARYVEAYIGWRGLWAIGLLPAGLSLLIRAWVPESPHWLIRVGRLAEARQSLAWALMVDPTEIQLPAVARPVEKVVWRELFKYPRSVAADSALTARSPAAPPIKGPAA